MLDVHTILRELAHRRPVFHSEADFQHSFAWLIHEKIPDAVIRLEMPFERDKQSCYLDLWVANRIQSWAFELKYKTRKMSASITGEVYNLKNHGAQDVNRYSVLKDIERLEHLLASRRMVMGYLVFVTNDSAYWTPGVKKISIDAAFRIHENTLIQGELCWGTAASAGTVKGMERPIYLSGHYRVDWREYSRIESIACGRFRYMVIEIGVNHNGAPLEP
jgi:hypothetical protein